jgi:hypothetical protein
MIPWTSTIYKQIIIINKIIAVGIQVATTTIVIKAIPITMVTTNIATISTTTTTKTNTIQISIITTIKIIHITIIAENTHKTTEDQIKTVQIAFNAITVAKMATMLEIVIKGKMINKNHLIICIMIFLPAATIHSATVTTITTAMLTLCIHTVVRIIIQITCIIFHLHQKTDVRVHHNL